jgi:hypothetical protein
VAFPTAARVDKKADHRCYVGRLATPSLGFLVMFVQQFGYIHVHEARALGEPRPWCNLDAAARKVNLAMVQTRPMSGGIVLEALDEVSHWARLIKMGWRICRVRPDTYRGGAKGPA